MRRVVVSQTAAIVCASSTSSSCARELHTSQPLLKKPANTTSSTSTASRSRSSQQKPSAKKGGRTGTTTTKSSPSSKSSSAGGGGPPPTGDDDEFDMDRIMETLFKASTANPNNNNNKGGNPMDVLSGMFGEDATTSTTTADESGNKKSKKKNAGSDEGTSPSSSAAVEEMFGNMQALMEEMNLENSRMINGAQLLQSVPTETESGIEADLPAPISTMIATSKGKVMPTACLPLQVLNEAHIDSTSSVVRVNLNASQNNRNTTTNNSGKKSTHASVAKLDSYIAPTNLHPTTDNYTPLASAHAVSEERHDSTVSSLPMEFFNEPCYQGYLQRLVYPHLNNHIRNNNSKSKGTSKQQGDDEMEAAKMRAEVPATLGRNTFPYHARGGTTATANANYRRSGSGGSTATTSMTSADANAIIITAPQPPGSNSILPSCMIHSTVDWSLPVFHRLQHTILFNEHLRGSSSHTTSSSLSPSSKAGGDGGIPHLTAKEAFVLEKAFLEMIEVAKSSLPEKLPPRSRSSSASSLYDGIPVHVLDAVYEFTVRLYFGTVAPARVRSCNTEFTDPRAQSRERLLTPLEACRLLVEPQGESESALQEMDEVTKADALPLRHRDSHLSSTSFTLIRERVTIEPESDLTTIDSAIAHVRRMAEISESHSANRLKDGPFSTLPPEEVRGEDGRLTMDYVNRYTKWMESETALKQTTEEERQKLLADPAAVEAMRVTLKDRELDQLREKTRALKARSKEQQAQLRAIYKLSPEEVLEKYGTLTPAGSMPIVLRKYELSIGQARSLNPTTTKSTSNTSSPNQQSSTTPTTTSDGGGGAMGNAPPNARTKTSKEPVYAFFYSTQPELEETNRSHLQQAGEAKIFEVLFGAVLSCVRESVASYRAFGEWPWERPDTTTITTSTTADDPILKSESTTTTTPSRGYGDVPYMSDAETTRAESIALPSKNAKDDPSASPFASLAAHPALAHVFEEITSSRDDDHVADIYTDLYKRNQGVQSSPNNSATRKSSSLKKKQSISPVPRVSVPILKSSKEIVQRLRLQDWRSTSGRLVSKKGDVIEQPPVGLHRAYLTFCAAASFSRRGLPLHDGVCLTITDPYCHGAQRAVPPASQAPPAIVGGPPSSSSNDGEKKQSKQHPPQKQSSGAPTSASETATPPSMAVEEWIPEHCALDKAIAQDYKSTIEWRDSQRPLPPAFRE